VLNPGYGGFVGAATEGKEWKEAEGKEAPGSPSQLGITYFPVPSTEAISGAMSETYSTL
jgi:hypothetical protein